MARSLDVHPLAAEVDPAALAGATVVVIDVLRASTTIIHALEAGARQVIPCLKVEHARAAAAKLNGDGMVLGGERLGLPIDGFDLGNSPGEYTPETIGGRTLVITTTNGTRAMSRCREARRVLIGAFVNATAVFERLTEVSNIHLLCAGTRGQRGYDDELFAGLLAGWLEPEGYQLTEAAAEARNAWARSPVASFAPGRATESDAEALAGALAGTVPGKRLAQIGQHGDVVTAARWDRFRTVPELDPATFSIRSG